ncbi:MAG: 3-deoxy-manno-octulosonate cytidylyltransferase [Chitinophagaceae bacterium]|nr:3-deoxy-manno-octulosonate cytidylyltransferase [Chitinophagaceae bacterium]
MIAGIIPARYASTRFPGKPLIDIKGKSMIRRVYEQAIKAESLSFVAVATDDERIYQHVKSWGGHVIMTSAQHQSGTERCLEAIKKAEGNFEYIINIQGDEPLLNPEQINQLAAALKSDSVEIATQIKKAERYEWLANPGEVKVVINSRKEALYFSRNIIPYVKDIPENEWHKAFTFFRHVGLYAYRKDILEQIASLPASPLEKAESLEQLRWLENGYRILCVETEYESLCVDTPEDFERILPLIKE